MSYRSAINRRLRSLEKPLVTYNNITVSRAAILHNFDVFAELSPGGYVIPVLKSNAYGHGLEQVAIILKDRRFPYLAVDGYFEALRIHEVSKQPVLVMGAINPVNFKYVDTKACAFVIHDELSVKMLGSTKKKIKVHLELETGMGRHGVQNDNLADFLQLLKSYPKLELEGVMTHLADADNPTSTKHVELQTQRFDEAVEQIRAAGFKPRYLHIAQSAGSAKVQSKTANTLRVGIGIYGISPLDKKDSHRSKLTSLRPALTLTSTITKVLHLQPGDTVSYNRTFKVTKPTTIGVLPLGYYEGMPRMLSSTGIVTAGSKQLPIAGRVCMNHTMVNLTGTTVKVGDIVTVLSDDPSAVNSIKGLCEDHQLFSYGLLVGLNATIRRSITN